MDIDKIIDLLKANYERAKLMEFVRKPLAWALYETWKYVDRTEKVRKR